jgi:hypothetical protein
LPKEVIDRLHTADGERLFPIEAADGSYRLAPYDRGFEEKLTTVDGIMNRYRKILHVLGE